ncbi:PIN domain-containing protein [Salana multivorans]
MVRFYLDTSVAVHVLGGTLGAKEWFDRIAADPDSQLISSRLLQTELTRVQRRDGKPVSDRDLVLRHVSLVPITEGILGTAEAIGEHIRTLDAIHLATTLLVGSFTVLVTHDATLTRLALDHGLAVADPVVA